MLKATSLPVTNVSLGTSAAANAHTEWLPWMDTMRVIAACGVVWIHTPRSATLQASTALGRFAVPFFLGAAIVLIVRGVSRHPDRNWSDYARVRAQRLLGPWVAWSLLYLGFKIVKRIAAPQLPNDLPGWESLCFGTAYHLWFLPYATVISIATFGVTQWAVRRQHEIGLSVALLYVGIASVIIPWPQPTGRWEAWQFMGMAVPGSCWSLALALSWPHIVSRWTPAQRRSVALSGWLVSSGILWLVGRQAVGEGVAGISFLVLAMDPRPAAWTERFDSLAPWSFGVYLSHLLVLKVLEGLATLNGWGPSAILDLVLYFVVLVTSFLAVAAVYRFPRTRWLVT